MKRDTRMLIMLVGIAIVALVVLWACSYRAAAATATCVTRPNLADRSGWWMYRIDRANGRRCWYQGVRGARGARTAHRVRAYRFRNIRAVRLEVARPVSTDGGSVSTEPVPREPVITILRTTVDPPPHGPTPTQRIDDVFRILVVRP